MTTREYVKKYNLSVSNKFNHSAFVEDLASDFIALLELNKADDNIKGFDNAVRCIRMKFDAISNKTNGIMPDKLWNYFFATVVAKLREEICPRDMQRKREIQERKQKAWEERQAFKREQEEFYQSFWERNFYSFLFARKDSDVPTESFTNLGLETTATENDVKIAYRKLSLMHHPDRGGKQEEFLKITESKNKCLSWIESVR